MKDFNEATITGSIYDMPVIEQRQNGRYVKIRLLCKVDDRQEWFSVIAGPDLADAAAKLLAGSRIIIKGSFHSKDGGQAKSLLASSFHLLR